MRPEPIHREVLCLWIIKYWCWMSKAASHLQVLIFDMLEVRMGWISPKKKKKTSFPNSEPFFYRSCIKASKGWSKLYHIGWIPSDLCVSCPAGGAEEEPVKVTGRRNNETDPISTSPPVYLSAPCRPAKRSKIHVHSILYEPSFSFIYTEIKTLSMKWKCTTFRPNDAFW